MGYLDNTGLATLWARIKQLKLANPKPLSITDNSVTPTHAEEYDGSNDVNITIPSALKNPNKLTFTGAATGSYDGSSAKSVYIPQGTLVYDYETVTYDEIISLIDASTLVIIRRLDDTSDKFRYYYPSHLDNENKKLWFSEVDAENKTVHLCSCDYDNGSNTWSYSSFSLLNPESDIFFAKIYETTYEEILTAYNAGKQIIAYDPNSILSVHFGENAYMYFQLLEYDISNNKFIFSGLKADINTSIYVICDSTDNWDFGYHDITIPTKLPNPYKLTFTGASTGTYDGSSAVTVNIPSGGGGTELPTGTVNIFAGSTAPSGWLLCDGSEVSRTTYADLFAVIGTTYGYNSSTTFTLPNLCGSTPIGVGTSSDGYGYDLGDSGGETYHTLTTSQMPSHTHTQNSHTHTQNAHTHTQNSHTHTQYAHTHTQNSHTHTQASHSHTGSSGSGGHAFVMYNYSTTQSGVGERAVAKASSGNYMAPVINNANADFLGYPSTASTTPTINTATATNQSATATNYSTTATNQSTTAINQAATATNQNTGGGGAHNNMQPYVAMNYIIKY